MASYWIWRDSIHHTVILDSSAILMCFEYSIDLESELTRLLGSYTIVVPSSIKEELEHIASRGDGRKNRMAKASLSLIKGYDVVSIDEQNADDSLVVLATKLAAIVVTNDRELRDRIKHRSLPVIFLRAKQTLMIE